jgi:hypothetical protein
MTIETSNGPALWVGTAADKNREHFVEGFNHLIDDIRAELAHETLETPAPATKTLVHV